MVAVDPSELFSRSVIPDLPLLGLSDDERATIMRLQTIGMQYRQYLLLSEAYYRGEQVIQNLRIAIPKELEFLRTIVGWPSMAVDPYVERLSVDSFMLPTETDADSHISDLLSENGFRSEQTLAFTDALSMGRSYWMVGSPEESGDAPQITVESPLNMIVLWDLAGRLPRAAMQEYWDADRRRGTLLLPNQTIHLATDDNGQWEIYDRDQHDFGFVPVVRMANRPRTHWRDGTSEISAAMRSVTDAACRTLLGLEVARELYSVPQKVILGASESDFVKSDGTPKSAWDTYITKVLALERDEAGELPELKQLTAYDPSVFTKLLDWYASSMAGMVAAPPQDMGLYTQGNPASAEAVAAGESRRDRRAEKMQDQFTRPLVQMAQMALRFENGGVLPDKYRHLDVDWNPITRYSPSMMSDAIAKQVSVGAVPPTSDVTLKRLGYTARERARLDVDRQGDAAQTLLAEIASSLQVKEARADKAAISDVLPSASGAIDSGSPAAPPA